jgi:regulatory protein
LARSPSTRPARPLDLPRLDALAVHYLSRFATTEKRLADYLRRKISERGWGGEGAPPIEEIVARCAAAGYVDDRNFAETRASSLVRRGYGQRHIAQALHAAGIARDIAESVAPDRDAAFKAAEAYARRRRVGPFGDGGDDPRKQQRQFTAMVRAGHDFDLVRYFVTLLPQNGGDDFKND